jgi:hypothetical protein
VRRRRDAVRVVKRGMRGGRSWAGSAFVGLGGRWVVVVSRFGRRYRRCGRLGVRSRVVV